MIDYSPLNILSCIINLEWNEKERKKNDVQKLMILQQQN